MVPTEGDRECLHGVGGGMSLPRLVALIFDRCTVIFRQTKGVEKIIAIQSTVGTCDYWLGLSFVQQIEGRNS